MKQHPVRDGALVGLALPLATILPPVLAGTLTGLLAAERAYFLLPAFALLSIPAGFAGVLLSQRYDEGRDVFRMSIGGLGTGTLVGASLLFASYVSLDLGRRLLVSAAGGPALIGFWVWIGLLAGAYLSFQRRQAAVAPAGPDQA